MLESLLSLGSLGMFILIIYLIVKFIKFRGTIVTFQEEIKRAKSRVRIEQNRYLKTLKNTVTNQENVSQNGDANNARVFINGVSGSAQKYATGTGMISELAFAYRNAQDELNSVIKEYNVFIGKFPNFIYAAIFKYSKEEYIDEENLDSTTTLSELDTDLI